jgi:uncharacterized protein YjeT (DUF2065 family)
MSTLLPLIFTTNRLSLLAHTLLTAFALVLIVEGLGPMLFPNKWQQFIQQLSQQPSNQLRTMGGVLVTIGIVCLYYLLG